MEPDVGGLPDPDWYFEHVLYFAEPGEARLRIGPAAQWQAWWRARAEVDVVARLASQHGFVAPPSMLSDIGWSHARLRTQIRRRRWARPRRGVIAPVDVDVDLPDRGAEQVRARRRHAIECAAAALMRRDDVVSGRSAAILHGLPTLDVPPRPELTALFDARLGRRAGAHVHGASLGVAAVESWFGVAVTTVARTLVDLARHERRDAIMAADAALHERLVSAAALSVALTGARGWPGVREARAVLALADPLAESPLESLVRLRLHDSGFPPSALQVQLGPDRVDLCWRRERFVVEADGRVKYSDDELWREKRRERRLRRLGYRVERVMWSDLGTGWPATLGRLRSGLAGE